MIKKMIAWLQWLDEQISASGFKTGAITGAVVTVTVAILVWGVL